MIRNPRTLIAGLVIVIVVGVYITSSMMMKEPSTHPSSGSENQTGRKSSVPDTQLPKKTVAHLYFVDKGKPYLAAEERVLVSSDDPAQFGKSILEALIAGPEQEFVRTIPQNVELNALYVTPDGHAYVDLSESVSTMHPGGSETELLTLYSIVNSLVLNVPGIEMVKILIDGRESDTLAGHIDLRFPFKANMLMVR